jgi:hypothetical protein
MVFNAVYLDLGDLFEESVVNFSSFDSPVLQNKMYQAALKQAIGGDLAANNPNTNGVLQRLAYTKNLPTYEVSDLFSRTLKLAKAYRIHSTEGFVAGTNLRTFFDYYGIDFYGTLLTKKLANDLTSGPGPGEFFDAPIVVVEEPGILGAATLQRTVYDAEGNFKRVEDWFEMMDGIWVESLTGIVVGRKVSYAVTARYLVPPVSYYELLLRGHVVTKKDMETESWANIISLSSPLTESVYPPVRLSTVPVPEDFVYKPIPDYPTGLRGSVFGVQSRLTLENRKYLLRRVARILSEQRNEMYYGIAKLVPNPTDNDDIIICNTSKDGFAPKIPGYDSWLVKTKESGSSLSAAQSAVVYSKYKEPGVAFPEHALDYEMLNKIQIHHNQKGTFDLMSAGVPVCPVEPNFENKKGSSACPVEPPQL